MKNRSACKGAFTQILCIHVLSFTERTKSIICITIIIVTSLCLVALLLEKLKINIIKTLKKSIVY